MQSPSRQSKDELETPITSSLPITPTVLRTMFGRAIPESSDLSSGEIRLTKGNVLTLKVSVPLSDLRDSSELSKLLQTFTSSTTEDLNFMLLTLENRTDVISPCALGRLKLWLSFWDVQVTGRYIGSATVSVIPANQSSPRTFLRITMPCF